MAKRTLFCEFKTGNRAFWATVFFSAFTLFISHAKAFTIQYPGAGMDWKPAEKEVEILCEHAVAWSSANGLQVCESLAPPSFTHLPLSLLPSPLPKSAFERARKLAPLFNLLVHRISLDTEWLKDTLKEVVEGDDFTARLLQLHLQAQGEGPTQTVALGLHRSDYMVDDPGARASTATSGEGPQPGQTRKDPALKQVEMNTIAASFAGTSATLARLHQHIIGRFCTDPEVEGVMEGYLSAIDLKVDNRGEMLDKLPPNPCLQQLPRGLAVAHHHYGTPQATVLFVVQEGELNTVDQRHLEFELFQTHGVPVRRLTLREVSERCTLEGPERKLILDGQQEVSVVYFRASYTPRDFPEELHWQARLLLERSKAIKCPNLAYHLTGTKKVQQVLCDPDQLYRFLPENEGGREVMETFARLYGFDAAGARQSTLDAVADAEKDPEKYVLKPQREGGGNNLYAEEMIGQLTSPELVKTLPSFILMERFFPRPSPALLLRQGQVNAGLAVSELGIYGIFLGDAEGQVLLNEYAGYLLRTKLEGVKEGGVATGYAVLSSPILS